MAKLFEPVDFLRRVPQPLLKGYCDLRGLLGGYDWADLRGIARELQRAGSVAYTAAIADFRVIWNHHGRAFTRGLMNEAAYHRDDAAYQALFKLSHLGKAFWATLERPEWVANASILSEVDSLPPGAWIKRKSLPARPGPVDQEMVERLESELIEYFSKAEHRGHNCRIECLRSGDDEIFFTYAEDHPDTDLLWLDGQLKPHVLSKSFLLIFKHNDSRRSLDIHIEGSREVVPDLQVIFARAVLGEDIARGAPKDEQVYALDEILTPGFQLIYPDELGIADARITKMRFRLIGEPWRRFMAEADVSANRDALTDFVENLTMRLPRSRLQLDQVCIAVKFHKRAGDRRPPSRQVFITYPNSLRLKHDELGASIVQMLALSGIERMSDDD